MTAEDIKWARISWIIAGGKAAEYTQRAEETNDKEVRAFFYRLRDVWISAANRNEMLEALEDHVAVPPAPENSATSARH